MANHALASPALVRKTGWRWDTISDGRIYKMRHYDGFVRDPRRPLPGEVSPRQRQFFVLGVVTIGLVGVGAVLGLWIAPESPIEDRLRIGELEEKLRLRDDRISALERELLYNQLDGPSGGGKLSATDRARHLRKGREYSRALRRVQAQAAAEMLDWFVQRWNKLLDSPAEDDRVSRRAATLTLLVSGMAQNLHPEDYVPWQAEFFGGHWLGELHFDLDGDGLPTTRNHPNSHDGFADTSICHIAMAFNQAVIDAQVLIMPDMPCNAAGARMSIFLQGDTFNAALTEFVRAVREYGFIVTERHEKGNRLILIGRGQVSRY